MLRRSHGLDNWLPSPSPRPVAFTRDHFVEAADSLPTETRPAQFFGVDRTAYVERLANRPRPTLPRVLRDAIVALAYQGARHLRWWR